MRFSGLSAIGFKTPGTHRMTDGHANVQSDVNALKKYGFDKQFDGIPRLRFELNVWKPFP